MVVIKREGYNRGMGVLADLLNGTLAGQRLGATAYWVLPGLVNAHDHLEFNLFPRLGQPFYKNSYQWGEAIYLPKKEPLRSILALPKKDRLLWGAYRNLLSGVTVVQHHNAWHWSMAWGFPITVLPYTWAHSPHSGKNIARQFRLAHAQRPFFIHGAEGTDPVTAQEIGWLAKHEFLSSKTVVIHGLNLSPQDIASLKKAGVAVVWCPASNAYLYGQTAPIPALLDQGIPVALGSDSTISGSTDLLAEIHFARGLGLVDDEVLYGMVTNTALKILGQTTTQAARAQDFLLVEAPQATTAVEALFATTPTTLQLVVSQGKVRLAAADMLPHLGKHHGLQPLLIDKQVRYVPQELIQLLRRTEKKLGKRLYFGRTLQEN